MKSGASALVDRDDTIGPPGQADARSLLDISDHSLLARIGLKGRGACAWLERRRIAIPPTVNSWRAGEELLIVRLGLNEFLIEGPSVPTWDLARLAPEDGTYPVVRQDTALALRGPGLRTVFAQACALNIQAFDPAGRPAVLTLMAEVPVLLIADLKSRTPCALVWTCRSYGAYLLETVVSLATQSRLRPILRPADGHARFPQSHYLTHPQGDAL